MLNSVVNISWMIHLFESIKGGIKHKSKGRTSEKYVSNQDKYDRSKYKECFSTQHKKAVGNLGKWDNIVKYSL